MASYAEGTDYTVDLALALAGEQNRLRLLPIAGAGALQNAKDVLFARGIDFGIVQTDVLDEIKRNPPFPGVDKYLQYITKLYERQVHILAGPDIQSVDDLRGGAAQRRLDRHRVARNAERHRFLRRDPRTRARRGR